jgi:hypothetical protein
MLGHTHSLTDGGTAQRLSLCNCGRCKNEWWVRCAPEFQPSYCPYCGMKFVWYDRDDGKEFGLSGSPRADG